MSLSSRSAAFHMHIFYLFSIKRANFGLSTKLIMLSVLNSLILISIQNSFVSSKQTCSMALAPLNAASRTEGARKDTQNSLRKRLLGMKMAILFIEGGTMEELWKSEDTYTITVQSFRTIHIFLSDIMHTSTLRYAVQFEHSNTSTNMSTKAAIVQQWLWVTITQLLPKTMMKSGIISTFDMLDHVKLHGGCLNLKCKAGVPQSVVYRLTFFN